MKKKIFGGILAVAIAAVAAVNVNFNNESEDALSALSLANVEALAQGEGGFGRVWVITWLSPSSHRCDRGGSRCCPDLPC